MNSNSFLHIADLHLSRYEGSKSTKMEINHFYIKKGVLKYIANIIEAKNIGAVLISGDLELDSCDDIIPYLKVWTNVGSKVFICFGEHDSNEKRTELMNRTKEIQGIYFFREPGYIDDESLDFVVYGMSCGVKQIGFNSEFKELVMPKLAKQSIFLTHPCALSKEKMIKLGCSYFAVGHIHIKHIEEVADSTYMVRPGHIYSIWDGSGKAWPVGAILGEFIDKKLSIDWIPFPAPQTIRLFIDPFKVKDDKILLCIENCTYNKALEISKICAGEWIDEDHRGIFTGYISLNEEPVEKLIRKILAIFPEDIFVTPSDSTKMRKKYGYNRLSASARTLLSDDELFEEFIERSFKASEKTQ